MMSFTHVTFGVMLLFLFGSVLGLEVTKEMIAITIIFSLLADIDHSKSAIGMLLFPISNFISQRYGHRTITHSMRVFLPLSFGSLFLIPFFGFDVVFAIIVGYLSHLISDGMNESGVPLLYPDSRPFWFLPKSLLIKTGNWQEFLFFGITSFFLIALTGISHIGLRSILHIITPSFHGAYDDFCKYCDGEGLKNLCKIKAEVCDENVCGNVEGLGLGLTLGNLILYEEGSREYIVVRDRTSNAVKVEKLRAIKISHEDFLIQRKPFSFLKIKLSDFSEYSTLSGVLEYEGGLICDNCNEFLIPDEVLRINSDRIVIHHLLVKDFLKLKIHGFIRSGHLTIKKIQER